MDYGNTHNKGWTAISKEDKVIKEIPAVTYNREMIEKKLSESVEKRKELELLLTEAKGKGIDISYPRISWALNSVFEKYMRNDLDNKDEYPKLDYEAGYILESTNKAIKVFNGLHHVMPFEKDISPLIDFIDGWVNMREMPVEHKSVKN